MIIKVTDFTGKYALSKGMFSEQTIQDYIDRYESRYLKELFGVDLYNQFASDLVNDVPQSPNFLKVFNPFSEDVDLLLSRWNRGYNYDGMLISNGVKDMLLGFIYYEYAKDLVNQMTPFGNTKPQSENSDIANTLFSMMYNRYNEAILSFQAIQDYIILNRSTVKLGQLVTITMTQAGTNIPSGVYDATGGTGLYATLDLTSDPMGTVQSVAIGESGSGYTVNDQLSVNQGNLDLIVNVDKVGTGDYSLFNGRKKLTAYWL